jgi:hypothetical protein
MVTGITKPFFLVVVPVIFYTLSYYSMLEPYSPTYLVTGIQVGLFLVLTMMYAYFGFIFTWPSRDKTSWQLFSEKIPVSKHKFRKLILIVTIASIFIGLVVWIAGRWLAYPTKMFAHENIVVRVDCTSKSNWGRSSRGLVMVEGIRHDNRENMRFPWPAKTAPSCPRTITVAGKTWLFGVYVNEVLSE